MKQARNFYSQTEGQKAEGLYIGWWVVLGLAKNGNTSNKLRRPLAVGVLRYVSPSDGSGPTARHPRRSECFLFGVNLPTARVMKKT